MKSAFIRAVASVLAAASITAIGVSANTTNTNLDYILRDTPRKSGSLENIGYELYKDLVYQAKKGVNGVLADPTKAEHFIASSGMKSYAMKAYTLEGKTEFNADSKDVTGAAKAALDKALGNFRSDLLNEINETYALFTRDYPELFWLSGQSNAYVTTSYTYSYDGKLEYTVTAYLLLRNEAKGSEFDVRHEKYRDTAILKSDAAKMEKAIGEILALPYVKSAKTAQDTVKALNKALTHRNAYHSDPSGKEPGIESHECISALIGSVGKDGPVCEGYAKAFKVLCDRVGIPCTVIYGTSELKSGVKDGHAWNVVKLHTGTYAVDVTFNDPTNGTDKAVSGFENEKYLLVGHGSSIDGKSFADTHIADCELDLGNGYPAKLSEVTLSYLEFNPDLAYTVPFTDVSVTAPYYAEVAEAHFYGFMNGISETEFAPDAQLTRAMLVTVLWRYSGTDTEDVKLPFTDVADGTWYTDAVKWAYSRGIVNGMDSTTFAPSEAVTREQALTMFRRFSEVQGLYTVKDKTVIPGYTYSDWAKAGVDFGYTCGCLQLEYDLTAPLTRSEAARYLSRLP